MPQYGWVFMIRIMFVKKWLGFRNGLQTQVSSLSGVAAGSSGATLSH